MLRLASEGRVVNRAISGAMAACYEMPPVVRVEYNDHFPHHPALALPPGRPGLLYVGMGVRGRQLEVLDRRAAELGFEVHAYLLGARLPAWISGWHWHHGPAQYEEHLLALVRAKRCLMWCCVDASSLSYRLATPNKFFQALAVGVPVVATEGTYLAGIVRARLRGAEVVI